MLGLYLHIPFCAAICNYCNFNRGLLDEALKTRYVCGARAGDSARGGARRLRADTIYFGGGTPSLLSGDEVGRARRGVPRELRARADAAKSRSKPIRKR